MMKRSYGILVYRKLNDNIEVLLAHMGGPIFGNMDIWSIPKGEYKYNEKAMDTALREFGEETSFKVLRENLNFLGSNKQPSKKLVTIFYTENNFDLSLFSSNNFKIEWPKKSGVIKEFPEMDEAKWMNLEEAKTKILKGQVYFINKLEKKLLKNSIQNII